MGETLTLTEDLDAALAVTSPRRGYRGDRGPADGLRRSQLTVLIENSVHRRFDQSCSPHRGAWPQTAAGARLQNRSSSSTARMTSSQGPTAGGVADVAGSIASRRRPCGRPARRRSGPAAAALAVPEGSATWFRSGAQPDRPSNVAARDHHPACDRRSARDLRAVADSEGPTRSSPASFSPLTALMLELTPSSGDL